MNTSSSRSHACVTRCEWPRRGAVELLGQVEPFDLQLCVSLDPAQLRATGGQCLGDSSSGGVQRLARRPCVRPPTTARRAAS